MEIGDRRVAGVEEALTARQVPPSTAAKTRPGRSLHHRTAERQHLQQAGDQSPGSAGRGLPRTVALVLDGNGRWAARTVLM